MVKAKKNVPPVLEETQEPVSPEVQELNAEEAEQDRLSNELENRRIQMEKKFQEKLEAHFQKIKSIDSIDEKKLSIVHSCEFPDCALLHDSVVTGTVEDLVDSTYAVTIKGYSPKAIITYQQPKMFTWCKSSKDTPEYKEWIEGLEKDYGKIFCIDCKLAIDREVREDWVASRLDEYQKDYKAANKAYSIHGPAFSRLSSRIEFEARAEMKEKIQEQLNQNRTKRQANNKARF